MTDAKYMRLALALAKKGCGWVSPNPMVGAVIVKDNTVIGRGYHRRCGEAHAERNALKDCRVSPKSATLYVTLEPCCHWGKTPPCTEAILESGIKRVVIGARDPNPLVAGKGIEYLQQQGIEVTENVLAAECAALNAVFFHYIRTGRPYVVMKYAQTMDGKIATSTGKSKWITGETARRRVQQDRHRYAAIMVGVGTVLVDDPLLTCRLPGGKSPVRVVCDTHLRTPLSARLVQSAGQYRTILATCHAENAAPYQAAGCEVLTLPEREGHVDLHALMEALGRAGLDSVLLEGGAALNWSALQSGVVNRVQTYIAPKLFGGLEAKSPIGGTGVSDPDAAYHLSPPRVTRLGEDLLLESEVIPCSPAS